MYIGAHVSPAGGLYKAIERGSERECQAIQIFNQSPRAWRPTKYGQEDFDRFLAAKADSEIKAVMIHAVYLLNCASEDSEIREKSLTALTHALRIGDGIKANCVVLHPGSALQGEIKPAIKRAGKVIAQALADSERCPLHLENTAGAGGTLGRSFEELAEIIDAASGHKRLGLCLDSCHLYASGYDIRTIEGLENTLDECKRSAGLDRIGSLHYNDSKMGLGSNRDRHANLGEGELGESGCAVFLSEPHFENLPLVLETPGVGGHKGPSAEDIRFARKLRSQGEEMRSG